MKKISSELKVGTVSILIIILFIWAFNFLKGQNVLKNFDQYQVYYSNVAGLEESSPVEINGLKAGIVNRVALVNDGSGIIEVSIRVDKGYNIPDNSVAQITTATLLAGMKIELLLGDSKTFSSSGDTLNGEVAISILDKLDNNIDPVLGKSALIIEQLDTLLNNLNSIFNKEFSGNIKKSSGNLEQATGEISVLLSENREGITGLIRDMNSLGSMLGQNSARLDSSINNIYRITSALSDSNIESTIGSLKHSLDRSNKILERLNNGSGSAGMFLNDDSLYLNLTNSLRSLDSLLIDIEKNPGRYVQFSLFGRNKK